jgi:hypothetical protein
MLLQGAGLAVMVSIALFALFRDGAPVAAGTMGLLALTLAGLGLWGATRPMPGSARGLGWRWAVAARAVSAAAVLGVLASVLVDRLGDAPPGLAAAVRGMAVFGVAAGGGLLLLYGRALARRGGEPWLGRGFAALAVASFLAGAILLGLGLAARGVAAAGAGAGTQAVGKALQRPLRAGRAVLRKRTVEEGERKVRVTVFDDGARRRTWEGEDGALHIRWRQPNGARTKIRREPNGRRMQLHITPEDERHRRVRRADGTVRIVGPEGRVRVRRPGGPRTAHQVVGGFVRAAGGLALLVLLTPTVVALQRLRRGVVAP